MARKRFGQRDKRRSGAPDSSRKKKKLGPYKERFKARQSNVVQALALNVRRLRKARGWSQEKLAGECGLEQQAISLLENGRSNPTVMLVESLAVAFDVSFTDLFETTPRLRRSSSPAK